MTTLRHFRIMPFIMVLALAVPIAWLTGCGSDEPSPVQPPSDTEAPTVTSADAQQVDHIIIGFSEEVTKASAENTANYVIIEKGPVPPASRVGASVGDIQVLGATLMSGGMRVDLTTEPMDPFMLYEVHVNVQDAAGNKTSEDPIGVMNEIKSGKIFTVAGTGLPAKGAEDIDPLESELYFPQDMTEGPDGNMYILDWNNHRVRVIQDGLIHTIIGTGQLGPAEPAMTGSNALQVSLNHPTHVSFDSNGWLCLSAWHNSKILKLDLSTGLAYPYAAILGQRSYGGDGGPAIDAIFNLPMATAFDPLGRMYVSDQANQCIRMIDNSDIINTVVGTVGLPGYSGDGGPAIDAQIRQPVGQAAPPAGRITFDTMGNLYICDTGNHCIRMVDTSGIIHTVVGTGGQAGYGGDGGAATSAFLRGPTDAEFDADGNLYIADWNNHCIRMVDTAGIIHTVAGQGGKRGYSGDGGRPTDALMYKPTGVTIDSDGNLWIADSQNHVVRVVYK